MAKKTDVRPWEYGPDNQPLIVDHNIRLLWVNNILNHAKLFDQSDIHKIADNIHRVTMMMLIDPSSKVRSAAELVLKQLAKRYRKAKAADAADVLHRTLNPTNRRVSARR